MPNIAKPANMSSIWASAGSSVAPSAAKIAQGWVVELPPYQTANYIANRTDTFTAHANQHGIPQWDSTTEYQGGTSYTKGSDGIIYKAISTNTNLDPSNPLNSAFWARAFEVYGSVQVVANNLAALDAEYRVLSGLSNLTTARNNLSVYSKAESDAQFALKNGASDQVFSVAFAVNPAHAIPLGQLNSLLVQATETVAGIAEISSGVEASTGTNDTTIMTPLKVANNYTKRSNNLSDLTSASQARSNLGLTSIVTQPESTFVRDDSMVGQVATFARTTAPTGWLICNGQAVSRATYANLFAAIGTLYGVGDGSTTFNLPDCRNEFMRGWDGNLGTVGTKFINSIQSHNHTAFTDTQGAHAHGGGTSANGTHNHSASSTVAGHHAHTYLDNTFTGGAANGDWGSPNEGANVDLTRGTFGAGDHNHAITVDVVGNHSHSIGTDVQGAHGHNITVNATGGSETRPRGIYFLVCIRY